MERCFAQQDIDEFANLVKDYNPLHRSEDLPPELQSHPLLEESNPRKPIVHGMLASSLFSCIFGTLVPGAVYLKQKMDFRSPVYANDLVVGRVEVLRVREFRSKGIIVTCDTQVLREGTGCVVGQADVWLPGGTKGASIE